MISGSFITLEMTCCIMRYSNQHSILRSVMPFLEMSQVLWVFDAYSCILRTVHIPHTKEIINKTSIVVCHSEHSHYSYNTVPCRTVHVLALAMPVIGTCTGVTQCFFDHANLCLKTAHRLMLLTYTERKKVRPTSYQRYLNDGRTFQTTTNPVNTAIQLIGAIKDYDESI